MNSARRPLRLMTWNIHGCVGRDGQRNVDRVGRAVAEIEPDIAAFQEVDSRDSSGAPRDVHALLRRQVGDHGHEAWSITGLDGNYGQMLASRFPLVNPRVHDLSAHRREPRKAIEAEITLADTRLRIIATHLGLKRGERRDQAKRLREIIRDDPTSPLILLGDFNDWGRRGPIWRVLGDIVDVTNGQATFPARFPLFALDRIVSRPPGLIARQWIAKEARAASDHLPVVAELSLIPNEPE